MEHTPGPWAVNPVRAQVDAFDGPADAPLPVCLMHWPTYARTEEETAANARLIAAAPELLAALRELLAVDGGAWHTERHAQEKARAQERARHAIAKATGEAS